MSVENQRMLSNLCSFSTLILRLWLVAGHLVNKNPSINAKKTKEGTS